MQFLVNKSCASYSVTTLSSSKDGDGNQRN